MREFTTCISTIYYLSSERLHELREAAEQVQHHLQRLHFHHEEPPPPIDAIDAAVVPVLEPPPYSPSKYITTPTSSDYYKPFIMLSQTLK